MICKGCESIKPIENQELGLCSGCNRKQRKEVDKELYPQARKMFLTMCVKKNALCPVTGTQISMESDVHHMKGRTGFADQWAKEQDISLLIDVRHFLAVSRSGHQWIETHPEQAKKNGWSFTRMDVIPK